MSTSYSTSTKAGSPKRQANYDNFLEAFRDLGKGAVSEVKSQINQVFTKDIPEELGLNLSGTIKPHESVSLPEDLSMQELNYTRKNEQLRSLNIFRQEELARMHREEASSKEEIIFIRKEIQSIAKIAGDLAKEFEIAATQAPTNPGIYHKNFFSQLRSFLILMRKRIQDSKEWLSTTNARTSKRGYYWSQVGQSGTKYMLSSERYMVTSTG
jgi:hypothetical protein